SATTDTFSPGKILYAQIDTAVNGTSYTIYVYSTNKDSAKYNLGFIDAGFGRGNYIADFNGANGKVYKWIAPVNGVPQGFFEPATLLVTPKKQQVITVGASYAVDAKTNVATEVAMSNYDINTLSKR